MVRLRSILLLVAACAAPFGAAAQERSIFDDVKLEAIPDTHGVDPYPNELVMLKIRGTYRPLINIAHMIQPPLTNFGWTNLTRDISYDAEFDGFPAKTFERVIAIFPEKSGDLEIGSFTHKLSVVDGAGQRTIEVKSPPFKLKVADWTGPGGPKDPNRWWLPSGDVRVTDNWSADPNRVVRGETVRRTVTIEADGVMAEQLPPPPIMTSPGVIAFRGPIERETRVTEAGPVARAVYRWDMRPTTAYPAIVQPIDVPWFDTKARTLRKAVIPAQRMAWAVEGASGPQDAPPAEAGPSNLLVASAGVGAFLAGLAVLFVGASADSGLPRLPPRALYALKLAAWRRDATATRAAVTRLARDEPDLARNWGRDQAVRAGLAELDRHLFDQASTGRPALRALVRAVEKARRVAKVAARPTRSALAPLDGPARRA